jgi:hypothetical protein
MVPIMFVYGIRCPQTELATLPKSTDADYYMEHNLLVFPRYTHPSCVRNYRSTLTGDFIRRMKRIVEDYKNVHEVDLEDPYITDEEAAAVGALQTVTPGLLPAWYYVPS